MSISKNIPEQERFIKRNICYTSSKHKSAWSKQNLILYVEYKKRKYYPGFQFEKFTGQPHPLIKEILYPMRQCMTDWDIAAWFCSFNYKIGGRPCDFLESDKEVLLNLAANICSE